MFSEILKKLMSESNISNYRLAKDLGVSNSTIANWINEISCPNNEKLQKLSDYFGVSVDYLLGKENPYEEKPTPSGELSEEEANVIALYRSLSSEQQKAFLLLLEKK